MTDTTIKSRQEAEDVLRNVMEGITCTDAYIEGDQDRLDEILAMVESDIKKHIFDNIAQFAPPAPFYTITTDDVGKGTIRAWDKNWSVSDFIGQIFAFDVGKRVYRIDTSQTAQDGTFVESYILQVESLKQFTRRISRRLRM